MGTILIIDDDSALRALLGQILHQSGWEVLEAEDGEAGIQLARSHRPEVVLCDLLMPRCNGFQVCRCLRAEQNLRDVKIIVTSGRSYVTDRLHALEAGADEYLVKPIQTDELRRLLKRLTARESEGDTRVLTVPVYQAPLVRFWGVRGSIPTPGPSTMFYGGNTSCVEVRADGEIIIFDAGSGIRALGLQLSQEFKDQPLDLTLLLSHTHWDHIQGFPFFMPAYNPRNRLRILGYEGATQGLFRTLSGQMESPYFPIGLEEIPANIRIEELRDMEFTIGRVKARAWFVNHPGICVGYRLETSAGSIAYVPDMEPFHRLRSQPNPNDTSVRASVEFAMHEDRKLAEFIDGADLLIMDSQYDEAEYQSHIGWGHACVDDVANLAVLARVKQLFLFHHDPAHDDEKVSRLVAHARQIVSDQGGDTVVEAAREGLEIKLGG
ncbi:MAG: response regulator [Verrucomicrobia bacterium]|nr:response regulator [Verrucomicrobiota bacterium]